jgi:hypothetical protein
MKVWKPLSKYRYTDDRDEVKYHTDFSLEYGEEIEVLVNGKLLMQEKVPNNKIYKFHFELAVEAFENDIKGKED